MALPNEDIAAIVKSHDWDRYIATLFAPASKRDDLLTLYAFDAEISRIRSIISDPLPGEIRLQWWREVVNGMRVGEAQGNALASQICAVIKRHDLPNQAFETYFDAKIFEYYHDVFPDTTALEAWCGETSSALIQLAAIILDKDAAKSCSDAAGHGGVALGIAKIIQHLPKTRARGQCFVPSDILSACGINRESFVLGGEKALIKNATDALCELGLSHFSKFMRAAKQMPVELKPAFLPIANAQSILHRAQKPTLSPAYEPVELNALFRLYKMTQAALR
jgi:15-cis-phytoene synthase